MFGEQENKLLFVWKEPLSALLFPAQPFFVLLLNNVFRLKPLGRISFEASLTSLHLETVAVDTCEFFFIG